MNHEQASSRRDHLTVTTKDGKIELTEEQLDRVSGGGIHLKYELAAPIKIDF